MMTITNQELSAALDDHKEATLQYLAALQEEEAAKVKTSAARVKMLDAEEAITDMRQRLTSVEKLVS